MTTGATPSRTDARGPAARLRRFLVVSGPALLVMLADTDAGSVVTAAQSGAQFGFRLLLFQVILIPILFFVQELTARLGIVTGKGHAVLIREHYGAGWAWLSTSTLVAACVGALLTEFGGIAAVGTMVHLPAWLSVALAAGALAAMALTGSYRSVERVALAIGAFEAAFVVVAVLAHPSWSQFAGDTAHIPFADTRFLTLVSANIGAVVMPWMVFYQQGSVIEKGLKPEDLGSARAETLVGAIVTQVVMASVLVAAAAALSHGGSHGGSHAGSHAGSLGGANSDGMSLDDVGQIAGALTGVLGPAVGQVCFGLGILGASFVAAVVVTLTAARTLGELTGRGHSLDRPPREEPLFYGVYLVVLAGAAVVVAAGAPVVKLSVGVQVMNALLLPVVVGFLFLLARRLPEPHRLRGWQAWVTGTLMLLTVALGLVSGLTGGAG